MSFIIDKIKKELGREEEEEEGFQGMNYEVGNTSGLDVGQIPTPLDRRVGSQAQLGGSVMEVKIANPSTFQIEKPELVSVIEQLGIDISLHSDPNTGYCSPYKTGGARGRGFEPTHDYFTRYLQELARFKNEVDQRDDLTFNIKRINPHASTSILPSLNERRAGDVGLDPFGLEIADLDYQAFQNRSESRRNIYKNPEFLKKFYKVFVTDELGADEYRYFDGFYASFSRKFDKAWRKRQNEVANEIYYNRTGTNSGSQLQEKAEVISVASRGDSAIITTWLEIIAGIDEQFEPIDLPPTLQGILNEERINNLEELDNVFSSISNGRYRISQLRSLPELFYFIDNQQIHRAASAGQIKEAIQQEEEFQSAVKDSFKGVLGDALDNLWTDDPDDSEDVKVSMIPVQSKIGALVNQLEIPQNKIQELAFERNKEEIRDNIAEMFGRKKEYFVEPSDEDEEEWKNRWFNFMQRFASQFEQALWRESNLFYRILPCWMSSSDYESEDHKGWDAPKFIWWATVERRWGDKVDIDLENPEEYLEKLENSREFKMDVAAASAACYMWGHFTQKDSEFRIRNDKFLGDLDENCTWAEWMNRFGIGVNMEAMAGSPQELFKLWRPKDIAVAARAINMTADRMFEEKEIEWNDELYGAIAKFTIDMEHVASLGADPEQEMKLFIKQEEELADSDYDLGIDKEKPLADILRMVHLMKAGVESQQGTRHGPFMRGEKTLYRWLYMMVEAGFTQTGEDGETAYVMYEQADEKAETTYMARISMDMIQLGITPDEVDPKNVDPGKENYKDEREALIARFFRMDNASYEMEWAKIEEHAFDPLKGLLQSEDFDHTWSSRAAMDQGFSMRDWPNEEYR